MKRVVDQAKASVDKSAAYMLELRELYDPDYPDYLDRIDLILQVHVGLIELLEAFRDVI